MIHVKGGGESTRSLFMLHVGGGEYVESFYASRGGEYVESFYASSGGGGGFTCI